MKITRQFLLSILFTSIARSQTAHFAIIGDYGVDNATQAGVASRVIARNPQFVVTVGDNNYISGTVAGWDSTQGKYYGQYIKYPTGSASAYAGNGVTQNNFFPAPGNHDWDLDINTYTNYFELPGNERYYNFTRGPVEFFILDSDVREPDGRTPGSTQYAWAQNAIQNSTARWQVVLFHHPAWSYAGGAEETTMRWPFKQWGADAVFSGHIHNMQQMDVNGLPYYVIGSSGNSNLSAVTGPPPDATGLFSNDSSYGFMDVDANMLVLSLQFVSSSGVVLNTSVIPEPEFLGILGVVMVAGRRSRCGA